jgi:hypothetical protein
MNKYKEVRIDCIAGREDMADPATITTTKTTTMRVRMMILCHHSRGVHKRSVQGTHNETLGEFR